MCVPVWLGVCDSVCVCVCVCVSVCVCVIITINTIIIIIIIINIIIIIIIIIIISIIIIINIIIIIVVVVVVVIILLYTAFRFEEVCEQNKGKIHNQTVNHLNHPLVIQNAPLFAIVLLCGEFCRLCLMAGLAPTALAVIGSNIERLTTSIE